MKMYCKIKRPDNTREQIEKGERIVIQEKIDGSNTTIYNANGKLKYFSRSQELIGDDGLNGFVVYIKKYEKKILKILPNGYAIFGEWLGQGKIQYNSLAKQGKISPYYIFDIASKIIPKQIEDEDFERNFIDIGMMKNFALLIGLNTVPEIDIITFNNYDDIKTKYVDNQKSMLTDCIREGVVIKTLDGTKRIKIVGDTFQEVKNLKNIKTESPYAFLDKYITPARIYKFLDKIGQIHSKPENYKEIFKQLDVISEDIISEEKEEIIKDVIKIIKKQSVNNIKEYLKQSDIKK